MPIKVVALLAPKPGCEAAVEAAARRVVVGSRTEPGCLRYDLWREPGYDRRYLINETFLDHDAYLAHRETPHYIAFRTAIADLLQEPPAVSLCEPIDQVA
jgi:quinol monooxygenase YgiN